jgi:GGDEF domain-containing protein
MTSFPNSSTARAHRRTYPSFVQCRARPAKGAFLLAGVLTLINENSGFDVGDEVIAIVGRRLGRALRGKDCIGRSSSNKFGVVLHDCDARRLEAIAERLIATVQDNVIDTSVGAVAASLIGHGRCLQALDTAWKNRGQGLLALSLLRAARVGTAPRRRHCR